MRAIAKISRAAKMLAEAKSLDEILHVADLAQAARDYAKRARLGKEAWNEAALVMLQARRKAGDTLRLMRERGELACNGGDRKTLSQRGTLTLEALGVTRNQSSRYQLEASVSQKVFDQWTADKLANDGELTASGLRKLAKATSATAPRRPMKRIAGVVGSLAEVIDHGDRFGCIYADPPWRYGNQATRAATDNHYQTMTVDEICSEPVAEVAADVAHLYLWTTAGFLREAFSVVDAWGFAYKSNMVWVKPQMGIGNYVRLSHEHLLIAVRGKTRTRGANQMSWVKADRTGHSRKPDVFRQIAESMSDGPYLEMYGRETVEGWTVYGNQVERKLL